MSMFSTHINFIVMMMMTTVVGRFIRHCKHKCALSYDLEFDANDADDEMILEFGDDQ